MSVSAAVITFNEEKHIASCLGSLSWADEIIVVDGESSDNTAKIARKLGARVYIVKNQPLMKKNMNYSFTRCHSDWILSLDADENVPPDLKEEILKTLAHPKEFSAFFLPRRNIIFGKWIAHSRWYPDYQLRLFRRGQARFPAKNVHEELEVDGPVGYLQSPLEHQNYQTVDQFIRKLNDYTTYEAGKLIAGGHRLVWTDAIRFPLSEFLSRFFAGKGYLDGLHGLVLALLQAFYWEVIFAKVWETQGFWQYDSKNFLETVDQQAKDISHQYRHWLASETKDPIKKINRKIKNRIMAGLLS